MIEVSQCWRRWQTLQENERMSLAVSRYKFTVDDFARMVDSSGMIFVATMTGWN